MRTCPHCQEESSETFCQQDGTPTLPGSISAEQLEHPSKGQVIEGRYRLLSVLGEGGMGVVWFAEHIKLRQPVAIKVLKEEFCSDTIQKTRFEREGLVVSRLQHPNVIRVQDFGHQDGVGAFLVMEYLEGRSLKELIKEEAPLDVQKALSLVDQITGALAAAHSAGMVHRDLKPANILIVENQGKAPIVKVLDFGIAKAMQKSGNENLGETLTATGMVVGTPQYMAPEQMSGNTCPQTDLYALGVIWFELLQGQRPFFGESQMEILVKHLKEPAPPISRADVPDEMAALVATLLAKEPLARPEDGGALHTILQALSATEYTPEVVTAPIASDTLTEGTTREVEAPKTRPIPAPEEPAAPTRSILSLSPEEPDDPTWSIVSPSPEELARARAALHTQTVREEVLDKSFLQTSTPRTRRLFLFALLAVPALFFALKYAQKDSSNDPASPPNETAEEHERERPKVPKNDSPKTKTEAKTNTGAATVTRPKTQKGRFIEIKIDEREGVFFQGTRRSLKELPDFVRLEQGMWEGRLNKGTVTGELTFTILTDHRVKHQRVVEVMDAIRGGGGGKIVYDTSEPATKPSAETATPKPEAKPPKHRLTVRTHAGATGYTVTIERRGRVVKKWKAAAGKKKRIITLPNGNYTLRARQKYHNDGVTLFNINGASKTLNIEPGEMDLGGLKSKQPRSRISGPK